MFQSEVPALVQRAVSQSWTTVASVPMTAVTDGRDVTVPLSILGGDDGRLDFRVSSFVILLNSSTASGGILDTMPGAGLPPGRVQ